MNLSEIVVRPSDTFKDLEAKVIAATIFGTLQATLTDFRYLRKVWRQNQEEERLLGISMTGIMDHPILNGRDDSVSLSGMLEDLKEVARKTNEEYSAILGIPASKQLTLIIY